MKGILTFSEDCWLNSVNKLENINTDSNTNENKDKNINNSELRYSITTNDSNILNSSYSYTQQSDYKVNQTIKEEILNTKNEEFLNFEKFENYFQKINKTEQNLGNIEH